MNQKPSPTPSLVLSPPYPSGEDNASKLYDRVVRLAEFLAHYREASNRHAGKPDCIPRPRPIVSREEHCALAMDRLGHLFLRMRKLREAWDFLVRDYEEEWSTDRCRTIQHSLLHEAYEVLHTAYMSREHAEAFQEEKRRAIQEHGLLQQFFEMMHRRNAEEEEGNPNEEGKA